MCGSSLRTDVGKDTSLYQLLLTHKLVGGLEHEFYDFPYIGNFIIPTGQYFSEGLKPPTRYT